MDERQKQICDAMMAHIHYVLKQADKGACIRFGRRVLRDSIGMEVGIIESDKAIDYLLEHNFIKQLGQHTVGLGKGEGIKPYTPMLDVKAPTLELPPAEETKTAAKAQQDPAVAKRIREARKHIRLNQTELSERIGVTLTYVSEYERGVRSFDDTTLAKIADALGASLTWLQTGEGDMLTDKGVAGVASARIAAAQEQADKDMKAIKGEQNNNDDAQADSTEQSSPPALSSTNDKSKGRFAVEVDGWSKPIDDHQLEQELLIIHRMVNANPQPKDAEQKIKTLERLRLIFKDKCPDTATVLEHVISDYAELQHGEAA